MFVTVLVAAAFYHEKVLDVFPPDRSRVPSIAKKFLTLEQWKTSDELMVRSLWRSERALQRAIRWDAEGQKMIDEVNEIIREFNRYQIQAGQPPIKILSDPTQPQKKK